MIEFEEKRSDEEEIVRLCRIISEDKGQMAELEEEIRELKKIMADQVDVIKKQSNIIEVLLHVCMREV